MQSTPPIGFYVYQLVDPRSGLPFYVGKGQRRRAWQHERAVRSGKGTGNARKDDKIKGILAAGLEVSVQIVAEYDDELDALNHEYRLVDSDPTLTNIMEGGNMGRRWTQEELEQRAKIARQKFQERRRQAKEAARERQVTSFVGRLRKCPGAELYGAEIDEWASRLHEAMQPKARSVPQEEAWADAAPRVKGRNRRKIHRKRHSSA